ncbi:Argininosuccinate lyase [Variovorax sp. PBS-H4]|uniref:Bug family tripartite tricarboxylate transporter substrate binding protein n=1 Tax=Variovorax sp. PBS-H4 TaxID=434008 RepID=UPI0013189970|nr:tripartite tricarboxylate transporter substrate binding protein [Variovorax sp. PBS-H4]VTU27325.1 Argininosuccinate lyase [Variovorax sp. PBS-H4]
MKRRHLLRLGTAASLAAIFPSARAQGWPERPLRLVVGFPPGQSSDLAARNYAAAMAKALGQAIVVDNKPGANGSLGAQEVKAARADGYTLLFGTSGQLSINPALYRRLPFDPLVDFDPVGLLVSGPLFLVAHPAFPAHGVQELLALAKAKPGAIDYGSGGNGVTGHFAMEMLQAMAGVRLNHIPYNGSPAALNDLMAGRISLMMESGQACLPHAKAGRLKVLACSSAHRAAAYPTVPPVAEQGLPDFDVVAWNGMMVPVGTPAAIRERLHAAIRQASADPLVVDSLRAAGAEPGTSESPAQFHRFLQAEIAKWKKVVAQNGITPT